MVPAVRNSVAIGVTGAAAGVHRLALQRIAALIDAVSSTVSVAGPSTARADGAVVLVASFANGSAAMVPCVRDPIAIGVTGAATWIDYITHRCIGTLIGTVYYAV